MKTHWKPIPYIALAAAVILIAGYLFLPRPIVTDIGGSQVIGVLHNQYFNETDGPQELIPVADYDEAAILDCLSRYSAQRTPGKVTTGTWLGHTELVILLDTGDRSKIIYLGNRNYHFGSYGETKYLVREGDLLRAELLTHVTLE